MYLIILLEAQTQALIIKLSNTSFLNESKLKDKLSTIYEKVLQKCQNLLKCQHHNTSNLQKKIIHNCLQETRQLYGGFVCRWSNKNKAVIMNDVKKISK